MTIPDRIHVGEEYELTTTFTVADEPADPTAVTVKVIDRLGVITDLSGTIENPSTGVYTARGTAEEAGTHAFRWQGTGAVVGVDEDVFFVYWSLFDSVPFLCTLEEARAGLNAPDRAGDPFLMRLIEDVTQAMTQKAAREFLPNPAIDPDDSIPPEPVERTFAYSGSGLLRLTPYDLREVDSIEVDGTALAETDYTLGPQPTSTGTYFWIELPSSSSPSIVTISGLWGMETVPGRVRQAAVAQVREWYTRDVARFSEAFTDAEGRIELESRALSRHAYDVAMSYRVPLVR